MRRLVLPVSAVVLTLTVLLGGCASTPVGASPSASGSAESSSTADTGSTSDSSAVPGSTVRADAVTAPAPEGQRVAVVVAADAGEQERTALAVIDAFVAAHEGVVTVHAEASQVDSVQAALDEHPDVIVALGPSVVGAVDLASASNLDQSFLVLGTQLAEPTGNVVAVTWPGADQRAVFADEEATFTGAETFAVTAIDLGLAAFPSGLSGHVIALG